MTRLKGITAKDAGNGAAFEVYVDKSLYWRWRLIAANGNIIADGGQSYSTEPHVKRAVERFKEIVLGSTATVKKAKP